MYMEDNDMRTPRDRVNENFLRQLLGEDALYERPAVDRREKARLNEDGDSFVPCGCEGDIWGSGEGPALAMVYSPVQLWRGLYDPSTGLRRGTIFKELDLPFSGGGKGGCGCE